MSSNAFLKISGISGESKDSVHQGWIDVESFDFGAVQPSCMHSGGGGGSGKVKYDDLAIFTYVDKATPTIFKLAASGKHLQTVELSIHKAGGDSIEFLKIILEEVIITEARYNGTLSQSGIPVLYKFSAAKIKHHYWEQTEKGGKGPEVSTGWNIKENREF